MIITKAINFYRRLSVMKKINLIGSLASIIALAAMFLSGGADSTGVSVNQPNAGGDQTIINVGENTGDISVDNRNTDRRVSQSQEVIVVINVDGSMLPIKKKDLAAAAETSRQVRQLSQTPSKPLSSCAAIRSLAQGFGLLTETPPNIHLSFDTGDISFFCEQKWTGNKYKLEFAARRAVLDAANDSKVVIKDKGTLSWAAQEVMSEMIKESMRENE